MMNFRKKRRFCWVKKVILGHSRSFYGHSTTFLKNLPVVRPLSDPLANRVQVCR